MSAISSILVSMAEFTNFMSILAVLLCVCAMSIFIMKNMVVIRAHGEDIGLTNRIPPAPPRVPRLRMTRVHIPFTFKLLESSKSSYTDVQCAVSSQVRYSLQAFWAVSIRELHVSLWRPWAELRRAAKAHGALEPSHFQHKAMDFRDQSPHSERLVSLRPPKPPLALGAPPRLSYPLVVFLLRCEDQDPDNFHPDETVALVNVVHLRDPVCPLPTSILAQYLKQTSGQLSCLKQLYLATGDPSSYEDSSGPSLSLAEPVACTGDGAGPLLCTDASQSLTTSSEYMSEEQGTSNSTGTITEQLCVVCQYFPLSRALLPCRHTCICAVCFNKLDRCPMCRAPITSYFTIRGEEYMPPMEGRSQRSKGAPTNWMDTWNDRLTDFLGFR